MRSLSERAVESIDPNLRFRSCCPIFFLHSGPKDQIQFNNNSDLTSLGSNPEALTGSPPAMVCHVTITGNGTLRLEGAARALGSPGKSGSRV